MKPFIIGMAIGMLLVITIQAYVIETQSKVHNPFVGSYTTTKE